MSLLTKRLIIFNSGLNNIQFYLQNFLNGHICWKRVLEMLNSLVGQVVVWGDSSKGRRKDSCDKKKGLLAKMFIESRCHRIFLEIEHFLTHTMMFTEYILMLLYLNLQLERNG